MKILMIAPQPFFEPRGTPISVYQRLLAVSKLGHEVDLLVYHLGKDVDIPGVRICRIPNVPFIKEVRIGPSSAKLLLDVLLFLKCLKMMLGKKYDVVHTHEEAAFFSFFLVALFGARHIYDMHSSLPWQIQNSKFGKWRFIVKLFYVFERLALKVSQAIITIGSDLQEYAVQVNPGAHQLMIENLPLNSVIELANGAAIQQIRKDLSINGKLPIVYTGSFEPYQGLEMLLECARIVKKTNPRAFFILVGGKPEQVDKCRELVKKFKLEDCTRFIGTVSPAEAMAYLDLAEVLVSPRVEGMSVPLKIYSYLYSGKPFVATNIEAHTQVLNSDISLLVEPTKEAFAEGIIRVLQDPVLRRDMGNRAKRFALDKFNFQEYTAKVNQIYKFFETTGYRVTGKEQILEE